MKYLAYTIFTAYNENCFLGFITITIVFVYAVNDILHVKHVVVFFIRENDFF